MNNSQKRWIIADFILIFTLTCFGVAQGGSVVARAGLVPQVADAPPELPNAPSATQAASGTKKTTPQNTDPADKGKTQENPAAPKPGADADKSSADELDEDRCPPADEKKYTDCRGVFSSSFYIGLAIDTFAGDDVLKYLNPGDSGKIHERAVGGIDFQYRLLGDHMPKRKPTGPGDKTGKKGTSDSTNKKSDDSGKSADPTAFREIDWHPRNLWIYGETVHGVRSADVDCAKNKDLPVCGNNPLVIANPEQQFFYMLRNATSLEGFFGFRWEFLGLQQRSSSPANLYFKGQAGFLSIAGTGANALDVDHLALGAIATKGRYENSYLEVGYGRSDMFATARRKRVKVDGYLQRRLGDIKGLSAVSLFVQILVDTDLGRGSDAIQSFVGLNFDLTKLIPASKKSPDTNPEPGGTQPKEPEKKP